MTAPTEAGMASPAVESLPANFYNHLKYPQRQTLLESVGRDLHARCLCLTLTILTCLVIVFWCQLENIAQILRSLKWFDEELLWLARDTTCESGIVVLPITIMTLCYVVYLVECWHCPTRMLLRCRWSASQAYHYAEQMRQAQPIIWWKAACYHHVANHRQVERSPSARVYHERVTTHISSSFFSYSSCGVRDISKQLAGLELHPTTRIYFSKGFAFANERSAREFDQQRSAFFRANERYDQFLEIREGLDLVGVNFRECVLTTGSGKHAPWYNTHFAFWLFSLTLLSWPLRILLEYNTAQVNCQIVKLFGDNYAEETPCMVSRTPTLDALSNCMIAPSYSEVMLTDRIYCLRSCSVDRAHPGPSNAQVKIKRPLTTRAALLVSQPSNTNSELNQQSELATEKPPSYDQVVGSIHDCRTNKRDSLIHCLYNLLETIHTNLSRATMPRSLTDKDFFQKFVYGEVIHKPWTSDSDIMNNLLTNV